MHNHKNSHVLVVRLAFIIFLLALMIFTCNDTEHPQAAEPNCTIKYVPFSKLTANYVKTTLHHNYNCLHKHVINICVCFFLGGQTEG